MENKVKANPIWPLILLTHSAAGLFFAYEAPGSLAPDLQEKMKFSSNQIGLLYSAYSIPAIASIFTNTYLQKRLGPSRCVAIFSFIIALGTFIITIAPNFPIMFIGQLLYGAGSSPMTLTVTTITGKWFGMDPEGKKRVSFVMGLEFAWLRFLSFGALFLLPIISKATNFRVGLGTSFLICASSFVAGFVFYIVDTRNKYTVHLFNTNETEMKEVETDVKKEELVKVELGKSDSFEMEQNVYILSPSAERKLEDKLDMEDEPGAAILNVKLKKVDEQEEDDEAGLVMGAAVEIKNKDLQTQKNATGNNKIIETIKYHFKIIKGFSLSYWLVVSLMVIFMSDLYTCTAFLTDYLYESKLAPSAARASEITSLVCLANVLTSPLAGWLSGYTGWKVKYVILGSINLVFIHILLTFAAGTVSPIFMAAALGLTQSIMDTNLWPSLIFTVPVNHYPFAMSCCTIMYNIGLIVFPSLCGLMKDITQSWTSVNLAFVVLSSVSVVVAFTLKFVDIRNGNVLDEVLKSDNPVQVEKGHH